ncbi:ferredoxin [Geomonas silvestris]|uniref:Ferredoxin n=1 Tax=Geomonas silvestris TaxID=2740184 RepID=A0A6V8MPZ6_9BACT|nr:mercury methylation ferredoxin HgcB [Geomonas silvestris]GFO61947.1 ferredoxin [Geomonas silvestris]
MKGFRYLSNVATLELDQKRCVGCGRCLEVCPHQVFALEAKLARIVDRDACMECGACAGNCPVRAITVDSGVGCATGLINEWLREKKIPGVGGGGCG